VSRGRETGRFDRQLQRDLDVMQWRQVLDDFQALASRNTPVGELYHSASAYSRRVNWVEDLAVFLRLFCERKAGS